LWPRNTVTAIAAGDSLRSIFAVFAVGASRTLRAGISAITFRALRANVAARAHRPLRPDIARKSFWTSFAARARLARLALNTRKAIASVARRGPRLERENTPNESFDVPGHRQHRRLARQRLVASFRQRQDDGLRHAPPPRVR
jgi:hypothetical protein